MHDIFSNSFMKRPLIEFFHSLNITIKINIKFYNIKKSLNIKMSLNPKISLNINMSLNTLFF